MDTLKKRIESVMREITYVHLTKTWFNHLCEAGIADETARKWVWGAFSMVEGIEDSLRFLSDAVDDTLATDDVEKMIEQLGGWAHAILDIAIFKAELFVTDVYPLLPRD